MGKKKKGTNAPNENPNLNYIANECVFVGPITINKIPSQVLDQHAWWRHFKKSERPTGAENESSDLFVYFAKRFRHKRKQKRRRTAGGCHHRPKRRRLKIVAPWRQRQTMAGVPHCLTREKKGVENGRKAGISSRDGARVPPRRPPSQSGPHRRTASQSTCLVTRNKPPSVCFSNIEHCFLLCHLCWA